MDHAENTEAPAGAQRQHWRRFAQNVIRPQVGDQRESAFLADGLAVALFAFQAGDLDDLRATEALGQVGGVQAGAWPGSGRALLRREPLAPQSIAAAVVVAI